MDTTAWRRIGPWVFREYRGVGDITLHYRDRVATGHVTTVEVSYRRDGTARERLHPKWGKPVVHPLRQEVRTHDDDDDVKELCDFVTTLCAMGPSVDDAYNALFAYLRMKYASTNV